MAEHELARFVTVIGGRQVRVVIEDAGPAVAAPSQPGLPLPAPSGNGHAAPPAEYERTGVDALDLHRAAANKFLADLAVANPKYL